MLLAAGADPNLPDKKGLTPLMLARRLGYAEAARILERAGATIQVDEREEIIAAIVAGKSKLVERLLPDRAKFAASLSEDERKLLPYAAGAGNLKAVRLMLDLGWDIETVGHWGGTALHQAAWWGEVEAAKLLLDRGTNLDHEQQFGGDVLHTAIHGAVHASHQHGLAMVEFIARRMRESRLGEIRRCIASNRQRENHSSAAKNFPRLRI